MAAKGPIADCPLLGERAR